MAITEADRRAPRQLPCLPRVPVRPDGQPLAVIGRLREVAVTQDPTHARIFASPADQMWLIDLCPPLHVDVLLQPL